MRTHRLGGAIFGLRTLRLATALPVALVLAAVLPADTATGADGSCHGQPATLVGSPGSFVTGTAGRDVVVTRGATQVDTGDGGDLVCVVGGEVTSIDTGAGADVVDATAATATAVYVQLGPGTDRFEGAARSLGVHAGYDSEFGESDQDTDVIAVSANTGPATMIYSGQVGVPNEDVVQLAGVGNVRWEGPMTAYAELTGGVGDHANHLATTVAGDVTVDLAAGTKMTGTSIDLRWTGFESHSFYAGIAAVNSLDVTGSAEDDAVDIAVLRNPSMRITAHLGRGDDVLGTTFVGGPGSSYVGGAGRDQLNVATPGHVELDMGARGMKATHNGSTDRASVRSFQNAHVWGRAVRIVGDRADNRLWASGCQRSVVRGAKGADQIRFRTAVPVGGRDCSHRASTVRFLGGQGHDRLVGGPNGDVLVGGAGGDRAVGRAGRDRCLAEKTRSCEIRR